MGAVLNLHSIHFFNKLAAADQADIALFTVLGVPIAIEGFRFASWAFYDHYACLLCSI
jgi:hypothetical protein